MTVAGKPETFLAQVLAVMQRLVTAGSGIQVSVFASTTAWLQGKELLDHTVVQPAGFCSQAAVPLNFPKGSGE